MSKPHPLVGKTVAGRFRVVELLGEGAMATVLRAEQDEEPRQVALKVMRPELGIDPTFPKRFRREAKAASVLQHPNVVRILDFGADDETHYIAMELLSGRDLFDLLARERRLSERRAARIVMQVCDALALAHGQGIIHRDLKPENIWMQREADGRQEDVVKVLDFGIAKLLEGDGPRSSEKDGASPPSSNMLTQAGTVVGTPEYMSPEQCKAEPVGPRSDVYACGVLLYQILAGRPPFMAESAIEITIAHVHDAPAPPSRFRKGLNAALERVVLACLEKSPEQRPKSAADLSAELGALLPMLDAGEPAPALATTLETAPTLVSPATLDAEPPASAPLPTSPLERTLASEGVAPKSERAAPAIATAATDPDPRALAAAADAALAAPEPSPATRRAPSQPAARLPIYIGVALLVAAGLLVFVLTR